MARWKFDQGEVEIETVNVANGWIVSIMRVSGSMFPQRLLQDSDPGGLNCGTGGTAYFPTEKEANTAGVAYVRSHGLTGGVEVEVRTSD
jgi:hypothetical protein